MAQIVKGSALEGLVLRPRHHRVRRHAALCGLELSLPRAPRGAACSSPGQEAQAVVGGGWAPHALEEGVTERYGREAFAGVVAVRGWGAHGKRIRVSGNTVARDWCERFSGLGLR